MSKPQKRGHLPKRSRARKTKPSQARHQSRVRILKRDGRIQLFNHGKMITSIRKAGATPQEAALVTNRVSKRLVNRETLPSKELSSMVARSLSRVNSTASRNYVTHRNHKIAYSQRIHGLSSEVASLNQQVNGVLHRIAGMNDRIESLPTRITRIRRSNYRVLTHLETEHATLSETWTKLSPNLQATANLQGETVLSQIRDLQQMLTSRLGSTDHNLSNLQTIVSRIPALRLNLSELQSSVASVLTPLENTFQTLDNDLQKAERTVDIVSQATFSWEKGETPIIATKVKDLNNDLEGFITLSNLRFILEHVKEIVIKKRLFIVTEKKIVREVAVQKPIGMVTSLVRGKVGFFKGTGLFVEFASESGIPEMRFDTSGRDADWTVQSYNYIISGQADDELVSITAAGSLDHETLHLVACHICGAPYTEKIYRGQTSVNCKYCGAAVALAS